jgi:hypothetical protein
MQEPIEGLSRVCFTETIEDRLRIGCSLNQKHAENAKRSHYSPAYLKGGIRQNRTTGATPTTQKSKS